MKKQELYNAWKQNKNQIDIGDDFADETMGRIFDYEQNKFSNLFNTQRLIEYISVHPFVKLSLVTAGGVAGISRVIFTIIMILNKGVING